MKKELFFFRALFTAFAVIVALPAYAAHPLIIDDADTQGSGKFQLEVNSEYGTNQESSLGVETTERGIEAAATLSYGVLDSLDVVLGVPYLWVKGRETDATIPESIWASEKGISDVSAELKWRFFEKEGLSMAIKPGISIPTGNEKKGLGAGKYGFSAFVIATQEFKPFTLHLNLGCHRNNNRLDERESIWHLSVAGEYEVLERLRLVANIGQERNPDAESERKPVFGIAGIIYGFTEHLDLDAGVKVGLTEPETDFTVMAGLAVRF